MEKNEFGPLPPEVWSHILSCLDDFNDIGDLIDLKIVNKLFYHELRARIQLDREIKLSKDHLGYFQNRDTTYSLPRKDLIQAVQQKSINGIQNGMLIFKAIVVGYSGVGKTALLNRYVKGQYGWEQVTIAPAFLTKKFEDPDGITTKIEFWDTAGQERFHLISPLYYRGARAVFMCFSIDNKQSFITLVNTFVPDVCNAFKAKGQEEQPVIYLLGLKSDLEDQRQVSVKEAKVLARVLKVKYFECSAKTNTNIDEMMQSMKEDLHRTNRMAGLELPDPANTNANQGSSRWCLIQ